MLSIRAVQKKVFDKLCASVWRTPPVECDPSSRVVFLSMIHQPDVVMYLVAIKSLARFVSPKQVLIVDDGLSEHGRHEIKKHLSDVRFIPSASVDRGNCPKGGCWERLLSISQACQDDYVIQVDADTVTVTEPLEVIQAVDSNRSFTLGTRQGRKIVTAAEASRFAKSIEGDHIQIQAESLLDTLPETAQKKYVRGCAGFSGFAPDAFRFADLQRLSTAMEEALGVAVWAQWGSEQFASNLMVANTSQPMVLPVELYPYWAPGVDLSRARLIHFIGSHRFWRGRYVREARGAIRALGAVTDGRVSG